MPNAGAELQHIARQRVALLVKQIGSGLSDEEDARLAMLSARVDDLAPVITGEFRTAVAAMNQQIADSMAQMDEILEEL